VNSFEHYKDVLQKLKEELEEKNKATSRRVKINISC
jgi:hypothetical protein